VSLCHPRPPVTREARARSACEKCPSCPRRRTRSSRAGSSSGRMRQGRGPDGGLLRAASRRQMSQENR
jgi:hypothetical protein